MMARRKRDLMFDVLAGRSPAEGIRPDVGEAKGERDAAAGVVIVVVLLVGVALGGYYGLVQDGDASPDRAALSATVRPQEPRPETEHRPPAPRRDESANAFVASASPGAPPYAVLVRTIQWPDASKEQAAVDEVYRLVNWLKDEAGLPAVRGVRIPGKNAYEVYAGGADKRDDLASLEKKIKRLVYAKRAFYFEDAFITNRPLDSGAARKKS
jgi:hypothetical protein